MNGSLGYALFFAIPSGTAIGSGIWLMSGRTGLGLGIGLAVGLLVFALVILGRAYGTADPSRADGP